MAKNRILHACRATLFLLALAAAPAPAAVPEYQLKAAFLYNFATFTDWPPTAAAQMTVCVLGRDPFGAALDTLNGKTVQGTALSTRRIATAEEARDCRVLFIGAESGVDLAATLAALKGQPILTIAEDKDAMRRGAMIGLISDGERIAFDINTAAARDGGLALSSKLLRLARQVYPAP
jgi:YfiR/HmsC-like